MLQNKSSQRCENADCYVTYTVRDHFIETWKESTNKERGCKIGMLSICISRVTNLQIKEDNKRVFQRTTIPVYFRFKHHRFFDFSVLLFLNCGRPCFFLGFLTTLELCNCSPIWPAEQQCFNEAMWRVNWVLRLPPVLHNSDSWIDVKIWPNRLVGAKHVTDSDWWEFIHFHKGTILQPQVQLLLASFN